MLLVISFREYCSVSFANHGFFISTFPFLHVHPFSKIKEEKEEKEEEEELHHWYPRLGLANVVAKDVDNHALSFFYTGEHVKVAWEKPFAEGEKRRVEVAYLVDHPITGMFFSAPDDAYPNRPLFAITGITLFQLPLFAVS